MAQLTTVYDCMGSNLGNFNVPAGVLMAAYVTGSAGVPWSAAQLGAHPGAVLIDQSPIDTPADELADVIDMEHEAATLEDLAPWVHAARLNYDLGARPGQRKPTVYMSRSNVTPVVNTLIAAGIVDGVYLWVAEGMTAKQATSELNGAGGPFPIVGIQYQFNELYDVSLFSTQWLDTVSIKAPAAPPKPGTQTGWRFCSKCQGLFWGPGEARSMCPRGGQHDGSHSHEYTLGYAE
jgi:hypothetical protein